LKELLDAAHDMVRLENETHKEQELFEKAFGYIREHY
jgi:hypothetical protein